MYCGNIFVANGREVKIALSWAGRIVILIGMLEKMRFAALVHDLGKAFSRHRHDKATVAALKMVMPVNYTTRKSSGW
ncbi:hypothetical protein EPN87_02855 [archaeon]|nr:MAG: hypothetical protein EPN87_02855 [archaeon]